MLLALLFISNVFAVNNITIERDTLYSDILKAESKDPALQGSLNEYLTKTMEIKDRHCKKVEKTGCKIKGQYSMKETVSLLQDLHNIMMDMFYSNKNASVASNFVEAIDGNHTPDSQHYAALLYSALSLRGIEPSFFKTKSITGLYFRDEKNKELFWCILTPLAKAPATSKREYVKLYNQYKNPKMNGPEKLLEDDIFFLDSYDFKYTFEKKSSDKYADDSLDDLDYSQKLLAPKKKAMEDVKEEAKDSTKDLTKEPALLAKTAPENPEKTTEKVIDLSEELAKPADPTIGAEAISAYEGSVDIFDQDGRIYANTKLRDQIKYESLKNITQIKKCAFDNAVKESRVILKYNIGTDGKLSQLKVDNVSNDKFKTCLDPISSSFSINKDLVSTNLTVMQIIKMN